MSQAIVTRYIGATNHKPSRVKAIADVGSVTIPWDSNLGTESNHREAARALAVKSGWLGPNDPIGQTFDERYACGALPSKSADAYVYVRIK